MPKILFAIGDDSVEKAVMNTLDRNYQSVGTVNYKEALQRKVKEVNPDILLMSEELQGPTPIKEILYNLKMGNPELRIILLTVSRSVGDELLASCVMYSIFDFIIADERIKMSQITEAIKRPKTIADVKEYLPNGMINKTVEKSNNQRISNDGKNKVIALNKGENVITGELQDIHDGNFNVESTITASDRNLRKKATGKTGYKPKLQERKTDLGKDVKPRTKAEVEFKNRDQSIVQKAEDKTHQIPAEELVNHEDVPAIIEESVDEKNKNEHRDFKPLEEILENEELIQIIAEKVGKKIFETSHSVHENSKPSESENEINPIVDNVKLIVEDKEQMEIINETLQTSNGSQPIGETTTHDKEEIVEVTQPQKGMSLKELLKVKRKNKQDHNIQSDIVEQTQPSNVAKENGEVDNIAKNGEVNNDINIDSDEKFDDDDLFCTTPEMEALLSNKPKNEFDKKNGEREQYESITNDNFKVETKKVNHDEKKKIILNESKSHQDLIGVNEVQYKHPNPFFKVPQNLDVTKITFDFEQNHKILFTNYMINDFTPAFDLACYLALQGNQVVYMDGFKISALNYYVQFDEKGIGEWKNEKIVDEKIKNNLIVVKNNIENFEKYKEAKWLITHTPFTKETKVLVPNYDHHVMIIEQSRVILNDITSKTNGYKFDSILVERYEAGLISPKTIKAELNTTKYIKYEVSRDIAAYSLQQGSTPLMKYNQKTEEFIQGMKELIFYFSIEGGVIID